MTDLPSEEEYATWFMSLSNWGRWGPDDRKGTLNLITPETRLAAAGLIRTGEVVSLSRDLDPAVPDALDRGSVLERYMQVHPIGMTDEYKGFREYVGIIPHGSHTHLDGLGHVSVKGKQYNGFDEADINMYDGIQHLSVHDAAEGFVTRGVLLDIPALTGREWLDPGERVSVEMLEEAEDRQGITVGPGDALLLYTGNFKRIAAEGLHEKLHSPGYSAGTLPWLRARDVTLISADCINDAQPSGFTTLELMVPVHYVALTAMGLWLVDNMALDELAATCRTKSQWEFFFTCLPWRMVGVTSSPINPIAIF